MYLVLVVFLFLFFLRAFLYAYFSQISREEVQILNACSTNNRSFGEKNELQFSPEPFGLEFISLQVKVSSYEVKLI